MAYWGHKEQLETQALTEFIEEYNRMKKERTMKKAKKLTPKQQIKKLNDTLKEYAERDLQRAARINELHSVLIKEQSAQVREASRANELSAKLKDAEYQAATWRVACENQRGRADALELSLKLVTKTVEAAAKPAIAFDVVKAGPAPQTAKSAYVIPNLY